MLCCFEIQREIFPDNRVAGIVGRQLHCRRINRPLRKRPERAVCLGEVDLRVKGLSLGTAGPVSPIEWRLVEIEVEVRFASAPDGSVFQIRRVVAGFAEQSRETGRTPSGSL